MPDDQPTPAPDTGAGQTTDPATAPADTAPVDINIRHDSVDINGLDKALTHITEAAPRLRKQHPQA